MLGGVRKLQTWHLLHPPQACGDRPGTAVAPLPSPALCGLSPRRAEPLSQASAGGRKAEGSRSRPGTREPGAFRPSCRGGWGAGEGDRAGRRCSSPPSPLPSSPPASLGSAGPRFREFYKSLMFWQTGRQRKRKWHAVLLTADLFSHGLGP